MIVTPLSRVVIPTRQSDEQGSEGAKSLKDNYISDSEFEQKEILILELLSGIPTVSAKSLMKSILERLDGQSTVNPSFSTSKIKRVKHLPKIIDRNGELILTSSAPEIHE